MLQFRLVAVFIMVSVPFFASAKGENERTCEPYLFKAHNPTAAQADRNYVYPNRRSLAEYDEILLNPGDRLIDLVPEGGTIVDVGTGHAMAMVELARLKKVTTIAINTQDLKPIVGALVGRFDYRVGYAEEVLKSLPTASVDRLVDLWGAFSYSPEKAKLLEEYSRVLKPGGQALIVFDQNKVSAKVRDQGRTEWMLAWLKRHFKNEISSRLSASEEYALSEILVLRRGDQPLHLGLSKPTIKSPIGVPIAEVEFERLTD